MTALLCEASLHSAYQTSRQLLLQERSAAGHWVGELASSALATATAVSALAVVDHESSDSGRRALIETGCDWLIANRNSDGGWGDTTDSVSNLSTTILALAALRLSERVDGAKPGHRADDFIQVNGGYGAVQSRYGRDKTFAVPILTNAALAKLVPWDDVSALPFELAVLPQSWYRFLKMPVVSYAIPALVAIGQARHFHRPPNNPLLGWLRNRCIEPSMKVLSRMQPQSGGYLEAIPLTSFVLMSLASTGRRKSDVAINAMRFLQDTVRDDGSWPIDTNLATWNTTLAINGLGTEDWDWQPCLDWLLACQHTEQHPFTGSPPGGWGWSDLSGAVPDADDTPGALLALHKFFRCIPLADVRTERVEKAASAGIDWLLKLQNHDGGWPTFCRGWGKLPFDRSGSDLTAHVMRALRTWRSDVKTTQGDRIDGAISKGRDYLRDQQNPDGSWIPLWFGNQHEKDDENRLYGTSKVLLAYTELGACDTENAQLGINFLLGQQNPDGGWGKVGTRTATTSGVEETSVALEALIRTASGESNARSAIQKGLNWLIQAVQSGESRRTSPIGLYFAKLWYHERLYPLTFAVSALRAAVENADEINS